jgi:FixJ family two-component response regulator
MTMAPVYLVDDDEGVRSALSLLLGTYGIRIETFGDPTAFLARAPKLKPGVLMLDLRMPAITGLQLHEKLRAIGCDWPTIICTGHGDVHACRRAFKAGVVDFLTKPIDEQVLIEALQQASGALDARTEKAEAAQLVAQLTDREREVLDMVGRGWSTKEIAETLQLSPRTVDTHRANIAQKLGTTSVAEFARLSLIGTSP